MRYKQESQERADLYKKSSDSGFRQLAVMVVYASGPYSKFIYWTHTILCRHNQLITQDFFFFFETSIYCLYFLILQQYVDCPTRSTRILG